MKLNKLLPLAILPFTLLTACTPKDNSSEEDQVQYKKNIIINNLEQINEYFEYGFDQLSFGDRKNLFDVRFWIKCKSDIKGFKCYMLETDFRSTVFYDGVNVGYTYPGCYSTERYDYLPIYFELDFYYNNNGEDVELDKFSFDIAWEYYSVGVLFW